MFTNTDQIYTGKAGVTVASLGGNDKACTDFGFTACRRIRFGATGVVHYQFASPVDGSVQTDTFTVAFAGETFDMAITKILVDTTTAVPFTLVY